MLKTYFVYIMGLAYILAGFNHFRAPFFYTKMLEGWLPCPKATVYLSGIVEILCGVGLMIPGTRRIAAIYTIALLVAIFPANIYMALHPERFKIPVIYLYLRLPLQLVLIWLAWIYVGG